MPATKRKYSGSGSARPLKRRNAVRRYDSATSTKLPLSLDHKLLRKTQQAVLRYHEDFSLNPTIGGAPQTYVFRANGVYDPNFTGTGHQPRGFDQLMTMYQFFRVDECQVELWFEPSDGAGVIASLSLSGSADSAGSPPSRNKMLEERVANFKSCGGISSDGPGYITLRCKPWEFMGLKKTSAEYRGSTLVDPPEQSYINVRACPIDLTDSGEIKCVVRITYHCTLTEPIMPTAS